jgi:hypothetical protein
VREISASRWQRSGDRPEGFHGLVTNSLLTTTSQSPLGSRALTHKITGQRIRQRVQMSSPLIGESRCISDLEEGATVSVVVLLP